VTHSNEQVVQYHSAADIRLGSFKPRILVNMAEALGIAGSIAGILQLTATVVKYLNDVKDASKNCNRILIEVSSARGLLYSLNDLMGRMDPAMARSLSGPLSQFKWALERLVTRLEPAHGLKKAGRVIVWPFQKGEVIEVLHTIERQKTLFILALQNDHV
jgi:hypothetical protein